MLEPWSVLMASLVGLGAGLVGAEALARASAARARVGLAVAAATSLALGLAAAWLAHHLYGRERWEPVAALVATLTVLAAAGFPLRGRLTLAGLVALVCAFFGYLSVVPDFRVFSALGVGVGSLVAWSIARHVRPPRAPGLGAPPFARFGGLPAPREREEVSAPTLPSSDDDA
jgi:hypothetical protein